MGWEDRSYYRDRRSGGLSPWQWLLYGSVPLFTAFGIRVRAQAMLVAVCVLILLFGIGGFGSSVASRVQLVTGLFLVVLLHEFGHCFAARWTGGSADEIVMTPLGGLAMTMARRRPWPTFVTVAGGPLVNVLICLICGAGLFGILGVWPLGPWTFASAAGDLARRDEGLLQLAGYLFWIYGISYALLIFNLLPIFPLDGGQLLQSILWKPMGYFKSMILTLNIGLVGSVLMFVVGLASFRRMLGGVLLILIAVSCFLACYRMRTMMKAEGPWGFTDEDTPDYGGSFSYGGGAYVEQSKKRNSGWFGKLRAGQSNRAQRAAHTAAREEIAEQESIDRILAKVSSKGMQSLTWIEKRTLRKATERQRQRDLEKQRKARR